MKNSPNQKEAIASVQKYLREISKHDNFIPQIAIDGIWGDETARAVKHFQHKYELPETGTVDLKSFEMLRNKYKEYTQLFSSSLPLDVFPSYPLNFCCGPKSCSWTVTIIQHVLDTLSEYYGFKNITVTGEYDLATSAAVIEFQKINSLIPDGRVNRCTWNKLAQQYNQLADVATE